jgi:hypothetical protein
VHSARRATSSASAAALVSFYYIFCVPLNTIAYHRDFRRLSQLSPTATRAETRQAVRRWPHAWPVFVGQKADGPPCIYHPPIQGRSKSIQFVS